ncbi:M17 family peptidase N-terminal domain-containing protein [Sphingomonas sp. OTU376]|uniref:M17 family peptidase N-terminal domain-containing protein n=1 Tax=Sphingomonas sp. OTU376 TaxID=3043863 RepID=UPI00313D3DA7
MISHKIVGKLRNIAVEVAAWDGSRAEVDLSCICMFTREIGTSSVKGGLAHVDLALGGNLLGLRKDGVFRARVGEALLIDEPPSSIAASALLLIGLGNPVDWTAETLEAAVHLAANTAFALKSRSAAFAPGMLDSGLLPDQTRGAPTHMVKGLIAAVDAQARLRELGLTRQTALERWVFDVGAPRFEDAAMQFGSLLTRK